MNSRKSGTSLKTIVFLGFIIFAALLAGRNYLLPILGEFAYNARKCANPEAIDRKKRVEALLKDLSLLDFRLSIEMDTAFSTTEDGIFEQKEYILLLHENILAVRSEIFDIMQGIGSENWWLSYTRIEKTLAEFAYHTAAIEKAHAKAVASINEDLGKSDSEVQASPKKHPMTLRDYKKQMSAAYPAGISSILMWIKEDCQEKG